jgi:TolB protein
MSRSSFASPSSLAIAPLVALIALITLVGPTVRPSLARGEPVAPTSSTDDARRARENEALGTVDVTGAAAAKPQSLALVPLLSASDGDVIAQLVVRRDLELAGQFDVRPADDAPGGPWLRDTPVEPRAWAARGIEVVVRVSVSDPGAADAKLVGDVWLTGSGRSAPVGTLETPMETGALRRSAHRLSDRILGLLTGRDGGFASSMLFARRVGSGQVIAKMDADGFDLRTASPVADVAMSPAFGPRDAVWYALSSGSSPFRAVEGDPPRALPVTLEGGVMGLAVSPDRTKAAFAVMSDGVSAIFVGKSDGGALRKVSTLPLASHPSLGPSGELAWTAGSPPRVFVDGRPISPAGYAANAPTFCDGPNGVQIVYSVGVLDGADLMVSDLNGNGLRRLTQGQGGNTDPACSPDGRLVAFSSTRKGGRGPGIYMLPLAAPSRAQRVVDVLGSGLRWAAWSR